MRALSKSKLAYLAVAIIVVTFCLGAFSLRPGHGWGDDFALYINQAQSLIDGRLAQLIDLNNFTTYVSAFKPGSVLYPWGYPLALAVVYIAAGSNLWAYKMLNVLLLSLSLVPLYFLFKDKFKYKPTVLLLLALAGFNSALTAYTDNILSDFFFLFISNLFLWLSYRFLLEKRYVWKVSASMLALGMLGFGAYLVRSNGVLLMGYLGIMCLLRIYRERPCWMTAAKNYVRLNWQLLLPFVGFLACYLAFFRIFPDESASHVELLKDIHLSSLITNIKYYAQLPLDFFHSWWLYAATLILFVAGSLRYFRKYFILLVYCGLTIALYIIWPARQGLRFIFPIIPLYLFFMLLGSEFIWSKGKRIAGHWFTMIVLVVIFLVPAVQSVYTATQATMAADGPYSSASTEMFNYVQHNLPADAVYIFFKPRAFTLITGRKSAFFGQESSLFTYKPEYLVINKNLGVSGDQITVSESSFIPQQAKVFENTQFVIYRLEYK